MATALQIPRATCDTGVQTRPTSGGEKCPAAILSGSAQHSGLGRNAAAVSLSSRLGFGFALTSPEHSAVTQRLHLGTPTQPLSSRLGGGQARARLPCLQPRSINLPPPETFLRPCLYLQKCIMKSERCQGCLSLLCFPH